MDIDGPCMIPKMEDPQNPLDPVQVGRPDFDGFVLFYKHPYGCAFPVTGGWGSCCLKLGLFSEVPMAKTYEKSCQLLCRTGGCISSYLKKIRIA